MNWQICLDLRSVEWDWGSSGGDYEHYCLLGCAAVETGITVPMLQSILLPPSSGHNITRTTSAPNCEHTIVGVLLNETGVSVLVGTKFIYTYSSMVQSPSWEVNWFAASQEIPRISRNPKVHYRTHKPPPPVYPGPAQSSPYTFHLLEIRQLILSTHLRLGLPSGLFPSGFPTKTLYTLLSSPIRATCPAHLILLDFITRTSLAPCNISTFRQHNLEKPFDTLHLFCSTKCGEN